MARPNRRLARPEAPPVAFRITTLGCKVNQYESCAIGEALVAEGLTRTQQRSGEAELVVINTCCVTATAMAKSRHAIARAVRHSPQAAVLVVGCYSDYDPGRIFGILASLGVPPQRVLVAGHNDDLSACIRQLPAMLASPGRRVGSPAGGGQERQQSLGRDGWAASSAAPSCFPGCAATLIRPRRQGEVKDKPPATATLPSISCFPGRQRAIVKVQDGCDAFCSYCIVPHLRQRMWSRPAGEVERECRALVAAGHREIVLCGVHLGAYGRHTAVRRRRGSGRSALAGLVRRVAAIEGLWRVRLSSLDCLDADEELLEVCRATPNVAPHLHLPLQSGSDRILRRMNRQYAAEQFLLTVRRVKEAMDRPAITTDVIVGFPGEADSDFAATLAAARAAGFAKIHAFPFSAVNGTAAWAWRGEAPPPGVVKARMAELAALEEQLAGNYRRQFLGQTVEALVESSGNLRPGRQVARTERYFTVRLEGSRLPPGQVVRVRIDRAEAREVAGTVVQWL